MRVLLHPSYLSLAPQLLIQHVNLVAHEEDVLADILCNGCSRLAGEALPELDITVYSMELCSLSAFSRHWNAISQTTGSYVHDLFLPTLRDVRNSLEMAVNESCHHEIISEIEA